MEERPMKPIDWAITLFVVNVPLIGLIMLFIWAFGNQHNQTRANFAKGYLLIMVFWIGLALIILFNFSQVLISNLDEFRNV